MMKRLSLATALTAAAVLTLTACGGDPLATGDGGDSGDATSIVIGSADFSESQLLATIYSHALQDKGIDVEEKLNIGSREVYLEALRDGSIDLLPEYNGSLLKELDNEAEAGEVKSIRSQLVDLLDDEGLTILDEAEAENADTLVVIPEIAEKNDLHTISDLAPISKDLVLAGPSEWKSRFEGVPGLKEVYGIDFKEFKVLDAGGPLTLSALQNGQAQVGDMFSSDPAIEENGLVALEDDEDLFPAANIVPVINQEMASDEVTDTLNAVSSELTTDGLTKMNGRIASGDDIGAIADDWLAEVGI